VQKSHIEVGVIGTACAHWWTRVHARSEPAVYNGPNSGLGSITLLILSYNVVLESISAVSGTRVKVSSAQTTGRNSYRAVAKKKRAM